MISQKNIPKAAYNISEVMMTAVDRIRILLVLIFCDFGSLLLVRERTRMIDRAMGIAWTACMMKMQ